MFRVGSYSRSTPRSRRSGTGLGANGVPVSADEAAKLYELDVYEVPVYGQAEPLDPTIQTLESALSPSRAVRPASRPYWVGETDGPKHLYILRLAGNIAAYLGRRDDEVEDKHIIKIGFSKSRRRAAIRSRVPIPEEPSTGKSSSPAFSPTPHHMPMQQLQLPAKMP